MFRASTQRVSIELCYCTGANIIGDWKKGSETPPLGPPLSNSALIP
jgi:hypothetical protein